MRQPAVLLVLLAVCLATPARSQDLGAIDFPTSGSPAAQPHFIKGVLLMHSFEYDDAREAFVEAQKADPNFAMAYWGEAMTFNHPVWQRTSPDLAKAALNKLAPTADARRAKAATEKEKDSIDITSGISPRNGISKVVAASRAPPWPKMS